MIGENAPQYQNQLLDCLIGAFIVFTVIRGIQSIKKVIQISSGLFLLTIALTFLHAITQLKFSLPDSVSLKALVRPQAFLLVTSACIGTAFDLPTFYRFAKSKRDGIVSIFVFGLCYPVVEICGALLYEYFGQTTIVSALSSKSLLPALRIWNVIFMVFSMCALNNINLYVSAVNSNTLITKMNFTYRTIIIGGIGIALACSNLADKFVALLDKVLIVIASIFPLLILKAIGLSLPNVKLSNLSVVIGILVGVGTAVLPINLEYISTFSYFNAALAAALTYIIAFMIIKVRLFLIKR